jgi:hypothetical protein
MAITITAGQREAIWGEVMADLTGIGDIYTLADGGDVEDALRLRRRYEDAMRLLDDLGWTEHDEREQVVITVPGDALGRAVARLAAAAAGRVHERLHDHDHDDEAALAWRGYLAAEAYAEILDQLSGECVGGDRS